MAEENTREGAAQEVSLHLLAIGCNYEGESYALPDCARDAISIAEALEPFAATAKALLNEKATRRGMLAAFAKHKTARKKSDTSIISFSGHGTTEPIDGKGVQAIVCNDGTLLYEHELRELLADLGPAIFIADCCYSGGLTRGRRKARTVPVSHCFRHETIVPRRMPPKPHATYAACRAGETAASTGKGGAFTLALLEAFEKRKDATTLKGLAQGIKALLPTDDYPQHPVFSCADKAFANRTIRSFARKRISHVG